MKKTYLSYEAPEVELVEMAVECGFAASFSADDDGNQIADYGDGGNAW